MPNSVSRIDLQNCIALWLKCNLLNPILLETLTAGTLPKGTPPPLLMA
ncbi:MAG: hypothetical protein K6E52_06115 [Bacteroidaceae bacterium]|nr:hypothetical protein [Bacteroidaceae bacterium]